jgi:hypothetical protein
MYLLRLIPETCSVDVGRRPGVVVLIKMEDRYDAVVAVVSGGELCLGHVGWCESASKPADQPLDRLSCVGVPV